MQVTRRETLHGIALLAVADKVMDGGYASVSLPGEPKRTHPILPPGAGKDVDFRQKCYGCDLCVMSCPGRCLRPSTNLRTFGQPELYFQKGHCRLNCTKCADVCPAGALNVLQQEMRPNIHMGVASWHKERCIRTTEEVPCTACVRACPVQAIHLVQGFPVVDEARCIGCGACEHVCPARPDPAMTVDGFAEQRRVKPMSEEDTIAEMYKLVHEGESVVVARKGVIVFRQTGRGIKPILAAHDAGKLDGAVVVDKVIGRAAAGICIDGGAKRVEAVLMSDDAAQLLSDYGVKHAAEQMTPQILNHAQNDRCPMEKAANDMKEPKQIVEAIRKAIKK